MSSKRLAVVLAFIAGPLIATTVLASAAGAMSPTIAGGTTPPPVTTLACKELHASIEKMDTWLIGHESYNGSGDAAKQKEYNDHFDMMASMQVQGRKAGCYNAGGSPIN
jgi:hypothetical protein